MRRSINKLPDDVGLLLTPSDEMQHLGMDVGMSITSSDLKRIQEKRTKRGECPTCGLPCFRMAGGMLGKKKKTPLTIAGHVQDGMCLTCNPSNPSMSTLPKIPRYIIPAGDHDNQTVVSGITVDHRLNHMPEADEDRDLIRKSRWGEDTAPQREDTAPRRKAQRPPSSYNPSPAMTMTPPARAALDVVAKDADAPDNRPTLPRRLPSKRMDLHSKSSSARSGALMGRSTDGGSSTDDDLKFASSKTPQSVDEMEEFEVDLVEEEEEEEDDQSKKSPKIYSPPSFPEEMEEMEESEHDDNEIFFDGNLLDDPSEDDDTGEETLLFELEDKFPSPRTSELREIRVVPETLAKATEPPLAGGSTPYTPPSPPNISSNIMEDNPRSSPPRVPTRQLTMSDHSESNVPPSLVSLQAPYSPGRRSPGRRLPRRSPGRRVPPARAAAPLQVPKPKPPGAEMPRMPIREDSHRTFARGVASTKSFASTITTSDLGSITDLATDVDPLLKQLHDATDSSSRVMALKQLTGALTDVEAKFAFCTGDGISKINVTMWTDIYDADVQQECAGLLLALVAKTSQDEADFLVDDEGHNTIDALLIVMQTLLDNDEIQQRGCRVLACLARASANNEAVSDGSRSGAVLAILNAMEAHKDSVEVMEWGVRTLYEFCTQSNDAEANKRSMWSQPLRNGESSWTLLVDATKVVPEDSLGLLWVLSSTEDGLAHLKPAEEVIQQIFRLLQGHQKDRRAALLVEAALGCLSNLCSVDANLNVLDPTDICLLALNLIPVHVRSSPSLCSEACAVVSRLVPVANKAIIVDQGGIDNLGLAMSDRHEDEDLHSAAIRTLLDLLVDSGAVKEAATGSETFSSIMKLFRIYEGSAVWQATACQLFASVFAVDGVLPSDVERDGIGAVCFAMTLHSLTEKVQETAIIALANMSTRRDSKKVLVGSKAMDLAFLAMRNFPNSLMIQIMTCTMMWNLEYEGTPTEDVDIIKCIVKAIQNHIESDKLLEVACGALLHLIYGSDVHKTRVAQNGGVEAVTCALVMHLQSTSVLEKLCEVLASLSASPSLAVTIIKAQCVGNMVEAVRNNGSVSVIRSAALFLKNVVVADPRSCEDAGRAITSIFKAMQSHKDDSDLQREACNYLWSVAALSEDSKSKILALDGISVLMETLEVYRDSADVQEAALGAFHELALSPVS